MSPAAIPSKSSLDQPDNEAPSFPTPTSTSTPPPPANPSLSSAPLGDVTGKLKWYYARLFPSALLARWLRYGDATLLARREVSFTLPGDIYVRWRSFTSASALHDALKSNAPLKLDIGAVYTIPPCDRHLVSGGALAPVEKELVFDIDMTDYADVLGTLSGGNPVDECDRCWPLMAAAVAVLRDALVHDFGFRHLLAVYSGRRGIHIWVADTRARRMTNEQRSAVAEFLHVRFASVLSSSSSPHDSQQQQQHQQQRMTNVRKFSELTTPLHPSLARARRLLEQTFRDFSLRDAGILRSDAGVRAVCAALSAGGHGMSEGARAVQERVLRVAPDEGGGEGRWDKMERECASRAQRDWTLRGGCDFIVLRYTYPRLDVNVSKEINHLLKAPFSVHPKTGRVCVPFRLDAAAAFRPDVDAPRIGQLLAEMGQSRDKERQASAKRKKKGKGDGRDMKGEEEEEEEEEESHTSKLEKAVEIFEEFVAEVEKEAMAHNKKVKMEALDSKNVADLLTQ